MRLHCLALCLLITAFAHADDADPQRFSFRGFGTLGYVYTDSSEYGFVRDFSQVRHGGLAEHMLPDSRLGLQLNYRLNPELEFVAQLVARDQVENKLARSVDWAFVAYRPLPGLDIRAGRIGLDIFMLSDYRNVGYAYSWVRPPMEFYGWLPTYSFDGADISYAIDSDAGQWRLKIFGGRSTARTENRASNDSVFKVVLNPMLGASLGFDNGPWRAKLSYVELRFDSQPPTDQLTDALAQVGAAGIPGISADAVRLRDEAIIEGTRTRYLAGGLTYDDNRWLIQAEYSHLEGGPALVPQGWRSYISVGHRFGAFTPFAVAGWARPADAPVASPLDWSALGPQAAQLQAGALQAVNAARIDQHSTSLGLRWDFSNTAAAKLQWDRSHVDGGGWGMWPTSSNPAQGDTVNLITATLDWVF